jgi:hypothetical protein
MIDLKKKRSVVDVEDTMMMLWRELMAKRAVKGSVTKTYHTANGTLYKGSKVRIEDVNSKSEKTRVSDETGRIFWIEKRDVQLV